MKAIEAGKSTVAGAVDAGIASQVKFTISKTQNSLTALRQLKFFSKHAKHAKPL
jgi:hypothetical protein